LSYVDSQFPHASAAEFVIAEVAKLDPVDSSVNGDPRFCVA